MIWTEAFVMGVTVLAGGLLMVGLVWACIVESRESKAAVAREAAQLAEHRRQASHALHQTYRIHADYLWDTQVWLATYCAKCDRIDYRPDSAFETHPLDLAA